MNRCRIKPVWQRTAQLCRFCLTFPQVSARPLAPYWPGFGGVASTPGPRSATVHPGVSSIASQCECWSSKTHRVTRKWLANLEMLAEDVPDSTAWAPPSGDYGQQPIAVHLLLGGAAKSDWALWPERDAILIGTQDMLLSRALNRGYSAGRARWPLEFGFLNNDCLWVFDEIQIMDTGLATSLQFDAWRGSLPLRRSLADFPTPTANHVAKPCHSLWMSATMAKHWLESAVDWSPRSATAWTNRSQLLQKDHGNPHVEALFQITKKLDFTKISLKAPKAKDDKADAERKQNEYLKDLADLVGNPDNRDKAGLTLIILNTVDRATGLYRLLRDRPGLGVPVWLIHSRFRPIERERWRTFLEQKDGSPRILISTQVVEAGVDLSAGVLYTELAPWASLVQRFGRCARYPGESGSVYWLNLDLGKENQHIDYWARPYEVSELIEARKKLEVPDVGLRALAAIKAAVENETTDASAKKLFRYDPRFVPRDKDLFDLFDTTPDLTGADVDVSRFIRDGEELDIQVFWREVTGDKPGKEFQPKRLELCPVPFHRFRKQLASLKKAGRIWRRNYRKGWEEINSRDQEQIYPGQVYLLEKSCGGYSTELGWTGNPNDTKFELLTINPLDLDKESLQDAEEGSDDLSQIDDWLTVFEHTPSRLRKAGSDSPGD